MNHILRFPVTVRVWENDFGIPSVDPECLQIMLLLKLAVVNAKFKKANLPFYRVIPSLETPSRIFTKPKDILIEIQKLCHGIPDCFLTQEEIGRVLAYKKYFIHNFVPAFFYDCWINPVNYENTIKAWYVHAMMYPLGYVYMNYKNIEAQNRFKNMIGCRDKERIILKLYHDAQYCVNDLASILSKDKRPYFLGKHICTFDTLVYSYLAVILYLPLAEQCLQNMIKEHPVLVDYVNRITKRYFPDIKKTYKHIQPTCTSFEETTAVSSIISGICVTAVMVTYAWNIGLITHLWPSMHEIRILHKRILVFMHKLCHL